jgi:hypothetical protein
MRRLRRVGQDASPVLLLAPDHVLEERASVLAMMRGRGGVLARGKWRDERVRVDLSVRMVERHADLDAAVLERHDVLDRLDGADLSVR